MKKIYLIRHAKSSWDNPELRDFDRPLAKKGIKAAKKMGKYILDTGINPDLVLCSPAARTRQTLDILNKQAKLEKELRYLDFIYSSDETDLLQYIQKQLNSEGSVMIVGHNPTMIMLTEIISGQEFPYKKFSTGSMAVLKLDIDNWIDIVGAKGELQSFIRAKDLKD